MSWWGKILGAFFGVLLVKSPLGFLLGIIIGYFFDRGFVSVRMSPGREDPSQTFNSHTRSNDPQNTALSQAYKTLGVSTGSPYEDVRKAYKRLMNQYHPDKLTAKGLPEDMLTFALKKTQAIQKAYDLINTSRKK